MLKPILAASTAALALTLASCTAGEPTAAPTGEPTGDQGDAATPSQQVSFSVAGMT